MRTLYGMEMEYTYRADPSGIGTTLAGEAYPPTYIIETKLIRDFLLVCHYVQSTLADNGGNADDSRFLDLVSYMQRGRYFLCP